MTKNKKILLLPSAKLIPLELQTEFGAVPSAMIPVAGKPALYHISEPYAQQGYEVLVAVSEQADQIQHYCSHYHGIHIKTVDVGQTKSLAETMLKSLKEVREKASHLVINLADTIIKDDVFTDDDLLMFVEQEDVYRWTTFEIDKGLRVVDIIEKGYKKSANKRHNVFVGVFAIKDVKKFYNILSDRFNAKDKEKSSVDPFFLAIQDYFNSLTKKDGQYRECKQWYDLGHLDTYHASKKALSVSTREFNEIIEDSSRGMVKKISRDKTKLTKEILWYLKLPNKLQYLAPRIFDYDLSYDNLFVDLEFYGYPPLSDVYLYGDLDAGMWAQIFNALDFTLKEMSGYQLKPENKRSLHDAVEDMYVGKTHQRIKQIIDSGTLKEFCQEEVTINGLKCCGLKGVLKELDQLCDHMGLKKVKSFSIIHGDFCLSNILYDQRNRLIRLVDPRGEFGQFDIYGDPIYDLAKLCHSLDGDYDLFLSGLFESRWEGENFVYKPYLEERHLIIKQIFHDKIISQRERDYDKVKFVESLLFLSMLPLHQDRPDSQKVFAARGLEYFSDILERNK